MRILVAGVFLACAMLAGCGGGGETAREGTAREGTGREQAGQATGQTGSDSEQAESGSERTFTGTVPEGVTVGRTTVDRPSPEERGQSEAALVACQFEEAEADLGREGLGALVIEMSDERVNRPDADFGQLLAERGYTCGNLATP